MALAAHAAAKSADCRQWTLEEIREGVTDRGDEVDLAYPAEGQDLLTMTEGEASKFNPDGIGMGRSNLVSRIYAVPAAIYDRAKVVVGVSDDPARDRVFTLRLTRYNDGINYGGRGFAGMMNAVVDFDAAEKRDLGDGKWELSVPLDMGDIADFVWGGDMFGTWLCNSIRQSGSSRDPKGLGNYLDFEVLPRLVSVRDPMGDRRCHPDANFRSAVTVYGVTLVKAGVAFEIVESQVGNVFANDETPETSVKVTPTAAGAWTLSWTIRDVEGNKIGENRRILESSNCRMGEGETVVIDLAQPRLGWYALDYELKRDGARVLTHHASFALLGRDTRTTATGEGPYGSWCYNGNHYNFTSVDSYGPLFEKAGFRRGEGVSGTNGHKYRLSPQSITWNKALATEDEQVENIRKQREDNPAVTTFLMFHEDAPWSYQHAWELTGQPVPNPTNYYYAGWRTGETNVTEALMNRDERHARAMTQCGFLRRHFPEIRITIGNSLACTELIAEQIRQGFPKEYADYMGIESVVRNQLPEREGDMCFQAADLMMQLAEHYGYDTWRPNATWESGYRTDSLIGLDRQAAWQVRDVLLEQAWRFPDIFTGIITDCGNSYANSFWGSSGLCRRAPLAYPKPVYVGLATVTKVLDKIVSSRSVPTGDPCVYVQEYVRADGKRAYALWTSRGNAEVRLAVGGSAECVDFYGRPWSLPADGVAAVGEFAKYVIIEGGAITSAAVGRRTFPSMVPPADARLVQATDRRSDWRVEEGVNPTIEITTGPFLPYRTKGACELREVVDEERGRCLELELTEPNYDLPKIMSEYAVVELKRPIRLDGSPKTIGAWVKGNSGWGQFYWVLEDANGNRYYSCGQGANADVFDYDGTVSLCYTGWGYLQMPILDGSSVRNLSTGGAGIIWRGGSIRGTVKLAGFAFAAMNRPLFLTERKAYPQKIRVGGIYVSDAVPRTGAAVYTGRTNGLWGEPTNWTPPYVPSAEDDVLIPTGKVVKATDGAIAAKSLTVAGAGAGLELGAKALAPQTIAAIGGDLTVCDGATLKVFAGALTNTAAFADRETAVRELYGQATVVAVGGRMTVSGGAVVTPENDPVTGAAVFFRPRDFELTDGASFDAVRRGWAFYRYDKRTAAPPPFAFVDFGNEDSAERDRADDCPKMAWSYAFGFGSKYNRGAGYGGVGQNAAEITPWRIEDYRRTCGDAYGRSHAPFLPGSPSGSWATSFGTRGSGSIVVQATGTVRVDGEMRADGGALDAFGGPSGGGIWLCGASVEQGTAARLSACGSDCRNVTSSYRSAGGGGRIAVGQGVSSPAMWEALALSAELPVGFEEEPLADERASTKGGVHAASGGCGGDGTCVCVRGDPRLERTVRVATPGLGTVVVGPHRVRTSRGLWQRAADAQPDVAIAEPADGCRFVGWTGVASERAREASVEIPDEAGATLTAHFAPTNAVPSVRRWVGAANGDWDDPSGWEPAGVPTVADDVVVSGSCRASREAVARSVSVETGGRLELFAADDPGVAHSLLVDGDLTVSGTMTVGADGARCTRLQLAVGGSVAIVGSARLSVTAAPLDESVPSTPTNLYRAATVFAIGGDLTVGDMATLQPRCDAYTGTSVCFVPRNLLVASGAKVDATSGGWFWRAYADEGDLLRLFTGKYQAGKDVTTTFETRALGAGLSFTVGAGHGNYGNWNYRPHATNGQPYGYRDAPFLPGSPNGFYNIAYPTARGGGVAWFRCRGGLTVNGQVDASAARSFYGGPSGGSVWLIGRSLSAGSAATLAARGGGSADSQRYFSGGAGGRVAVALGLTDAEVDELALGGRPGTLTYEEAIDALSVDVSGGPEGTLNGTYPQQYAPTGTVSTVRGALADRSVRVGGWPVLAGSPEPGYGMSPGRVGERLSFVASADGYGCDPADPEGMRWRCAGYVVSNATEEIARGDGSSFELEMPPADITVAWRWTAPQRAVRADNPQGAAFGAVAVDGSVRPDDGCAWADEGTSVTLEAQPADGCEFLCWLGDFPYGKATSSRIVLTTEASKRIRPLFRRSEAPAARTWIGGTGLFIETNNWSGGNLPGRADAVVMLGGTCVASNFVQVGSLAMTNGTLRVGTLSAAGHEEAGLVLSGELLLAGTSRLEVGDARDAEPGPRPHGRVEAARIGLSGSSRLQVAGGALGGAFTVERGAGFVRTGRFVLADEATYRPLSDPLTGGSVVAEVGSFALAEGARVDAVGAGFRVWEGTPSRAPGAGYDYSIGGGYGGEGGSHAGDPRYGNAYGEAAAPVWPGSPNGTYHAPYMRGGGLVRIHARGRMELRGTITAAAQEPPWTDNYFFGGASGGGVWLTAARFVFGAGARLDAHGGYSTYGSGGGGGRIALWKGARPDAEEDFAAAFPSVSVDVSGGSRYTNLLESPTKAHDLVGPSGADGTLYFVATLPFVLFIR